jgi:PAP2 superfamily
MTIAARDAIPTPTITGTSRAARAKEMAHRSRTVLLFMAPLPELMLAIGFALVAFGIARTFALPIVLPDATALQFTGMNFAIPISLIFGWGLYTVVTKRQMRVPYYIIATMAYGIILIAHFNVKMSMNMVNPWRWDALYWNVDEALRPLVDASFAIHRGVDWALPGMDQLYFFAFIAMFGSSIFVHSMGRFIIFRKVIFTAMLVHVLGALSYLVMPAVGPFIYEHGANAIETTRQLHMMGSYEALMAGGRPWMAEQGGHYLFAAIGAMPSLHVASSAVFVYYALKHERWLGYCYLPLFFFIMAEAVATRWHYLTDVIAGVALTALAVWICSIVFKPIEAHHRERE